MAKISRTDVEHVALLSRIELTEQEIELFQSQLTNILEYIEKLNELDTEEVEPMSSVMGIHNVFRDDEVRESLPVERVLENAPERGKDTFLVPAVVE